MEKRNGSKDLLNSIKSSFILQIIISFIEEKKKLNIIKYNKTIQNKLKIEFEDFKLNGLYIEYNNNGIGCEYTIKDGALIFEGEYSKGKRIGKGKEYLDNNLVFEGIFLNGKKVDGIGYNNNGQIICEIKNGKFKEYHNNGKLKFKGEYLNNKIWNGKFYDINGEFESEIKNENGFGKKYDNYNNYLLYEGEYKIGLRNGKGREYMEKHWGYSLIYEGEYFYGFRNGKGKEYFGKGFIYDGNPIKFEGIYKYGDKWTGKFYDYKCNIESEIKDGNGIIKEYDEYNNILKYEGEYKNGKKNGIGKEFYCDGILYLFKDYKNSLYF